MFLQYKATCSIAWWSRYSVKLPWRYFLTPLSVLTFHFSNCASTWQTIYNILQGLVLSKQVCKRKGSYSFAYITWLMHSLPHFLPLSFIYVYIFFISNHLTRSLFSSSIMTDQSSQHHVPSHPSYPFDHLFAVGYTSLPKINVFLFHWKGLIPLPVATFFPRANESNKYCTQPNSPNDDFYIIHVCSSLCMINLLPNKDITVLATIHSKPSLGLSTCPWKLLHKWRLLHYFCWQI